MPRNPNSKYPKTPPPNHITKQEACLFCEIKINSFAGSYWAWKKRLDLPDPVKVLVEGIRTLFYDRAAVEKMAEAVHKRGRKTNQNGEWMDNCRRMRQMMQNVTEEQEESNPALRLVNQIRAARHIGMPLDAFLKYDAEGLSLPLDYFIRMQSLDVVETRRKTRTRGVYKAHVPERS